MTEPVSFVNRASAQRCSADGLSDQAGWDALG